MHSPKINFQAICIVSNDKHFNHTGTAIECTAIFPERWWTQFEVRKSPTLSSLPCPKVCLRKVFGTAKSGVVNCSTPRLVLQLHKSKPRKFQLGSEKIKKEVSGKRLTDYFNICRYWNSLPRLVSTTLSGLVVSFHAYKDTFRYEYWNNIWILE